MRQPCRFTLFLASLLLFIPLLLSAQGWEFICPAIYDDIAVLNRNVVLVTQRFPNNVTSLLRSDDGGETWRLMSTDYQRYISNLDFFTDEEGLGWSTSGSVYHTSDQGEHWDTVLSVPSSRYDYLRDLKTNGGDTVLAMVGVHRLMRSTDRGNTWDSVLIDTITSDPFDYYPSFLAARGSVAYRLRYDRLDRSDDGGAHWRQRALPDTGRFLSLVVVDSLRALAASGDYSASLYRTDDAGVTWQRVYHDTNWIPNSVHDLDLLADGSIMTVIAERRSVAVRLLFSNDTGIVWRTIDVPAKAGQSLQGRALIEGRLLWTGGPGIYQWDTLTGWRTTAYFPQVNVWPAGPAMTLGPLHAASTVRWGLLATYNYGLPPHQFYVTDDTGATWLPATAVYENLFAGVHFLDTMQGVGLHPRGWLMSTTDGGLHWGDTTRPSGVPDNMIGGSTKWQGITFAPGGKVGAIWDSTSLYRTSDAGISWTSVPLDRASDSLSVDKVIYFDQRHALMVRGTPLRQITKPVTSYISDKLLYASNDGGVTWSRTYPTDPHDTLHHTSISVVSVRRGEIRIRVSTVAPSFIQYDLQSNDFGNSWQLITVPDIEQSFSRVEFFSDSDAWGVGSGIYHSTDGGTTWELEMDSIRSDYIALTPDRGTLIVNATELTVARKILADLIPASVSREHRTTAVATLRVLAGTGEDDRVVEIGSAVREAGAVLVSDMQGRIVIEPIVVAAGTRRVPINVRALASGSYTIVYRTAEGIAGTSLVIVR